eukprot:755765-Pleurochrysis_carterae.AAC.1
MHDASPRWDEYRKGWRVMQFPMAADDASDVKESRNDPRSNTWGLVWVSTIHIIRNPALLYASQYTSPMGEEFLCLSYLYNAFCASL